MTKKELLKMIEDEVTAVLQSTVSEPSIQKPVTPIQIKANISDEELEEALFYGGELPKEVKEDLKLKNKK